MTPVPLIFKSETVPRVFANEWSHHKRFSSRTKKKEESEERERYTLTYTHRYTHLGTLLYRFYNYLVYKLR